MLLPWADHDPAILDKERTKDVQDYLETCIGRREPITKVLKLLSLFCLADDGFPSKQFDQYRREIIQVRGRQCLS